MSDKELHEQGTIEGYVSLSAPPAAAAAPDNSANSGRTISPVTGARPDNSAAAGGPLTEKEWHDLEALAKGELRWTYASDPAKLAKLLAVAAHHRAEGERLANLLALHNCGTVADLNVYIGALEESSQRAEAALREAANLIANDGFAMTFQTMGQYRMALLLVVKNALSGARPGETT